MENQLIRDMKILIIRNFPSYMEVRNNTYNIQEVGLAKAFVRKGYSCDIIFWTDKDEEVVNIPVDDLGCITVFYKRGKTKFKNTVFMDCEELYEKYDILQPCEYNQIQSWLLAKKYPDKVLIYHGPYYSPFNKRYNAMCKVFDMFLLKRYIKLDTPFLVKSELAKSFLHEKGIRAKNINTVGVGIDYEMLSSASAENNQELYLKMKEEESEIKFLYVGRFEKRRNIVFILKVFSKIYRQYKNVKLYLIGTGDEKYLVSIRELINKLELTESVVWQEKIEQKYLSNIYSEADFFLLPTEYEIFGMVLLEAMYYKTVVVTNTNGGSSTLMINGINGLVIDSADEDTWADKILYLIQNQEQVEKIKEGASNLIASYFTWDKRVDLFLHEYNKLREISLTDTFYI